MVKFLPLPLYEAFDRGIDVFWETSFLFKQPTPNWQGMMHLLHQHMDHPGKSTIAFLPIIDMYPGDKSCIFSTLEYLSKLASDQNCPAVVTFDQPLFWKASQIKEEVVEDSLVHKVVLLLGSFHTFMNLLGAIGMPKSL